MDTALIYGDGHSEQLVGDALKTIASRVYVATKIPPKNGRWPARPTTKLKDAFPASWITQCTERSLKHLRLDCIDLQQLHVWTGAWLKETEWLETLQRLKRDGKIKYFGVSVNDHDPAGAVELARAGVIDTVQVIYNVFDQTPADALLPLCQSQDIGVIARVPFDEGSLTGALTTETTFDRSDWRRAYFKGPRLRETVERANRLKPVLVRDGIKTLAQGALTFVLSHPAVSTVIPGMRSVEHLDENLAVVDQPRLDAATLGTLKQHAWPRNFYEGIW